ncbi:MAG: DEAD/DEAH box helicase [Nitrospirae bacterium]|nr:DEAD/DEAH box helicase [Nitrospirota bacterium]
MTFSELELCPALLKTIEKSGYTTPTPIQEKAIPPALNGKDVMGLAQTGTGKTAAFALPILQRLMKGPKGRIRTLVVAPTRELAEQIYDTFGMLGKGTGMSGATIYGGVGMMPQIQKLRRGVEVVVACPGRLLDHLGRGTIDLSHVETLVLDEADRMFDMGFLPDVKRIISYLPAGRQTLFFSATMPDDIRKLSHEILRDPVTVQVDLTAPVNSVSHALYPVGQHLKTGLLMELLKHTDTESVLIFTRTKHRAKKLSEHLERHDYRATCLQGNLSQNKRQEALDGFRSGRYQILVATDIAARGIDVSSISHVVNYDMPDTADAYTHRIGRTGRAAKTGDAFTFVSPEDNDMVRTIERVLGMKIERRKIEGFDYGVQAPPRSAEPPRGGYGQRRTSAPSTTARKPGEWRPYAPKSEGQYPERRPATASHGPKSESGANSPRHPSQRPAQAGGRPPMNSDRRSGQQPRQGR